MIAGNHYKYVDPEYINEMADGEDDFIIQIIDIYLDNIPNNITQLQQAADAGDYAAILFSTHKLRGSFNFIGGKELILTLDKIDELCHAQADLQSIRQLVTQVLAIANKVLEELKEIHTQVMKSMEV